MKRIETIDELKKAIDNIDWEQLHMDRVFYDRGYWIWLYWDGEKVHTELQSQSRSPGPDNVLFGMFPCDIDGSDYQYSEGWATYVDDCENDNYGKYIDNESGLIMTEHEMIIDAIENGDWTDAYCDWKEQLIHDFENEQAALEGVERAERIYNYFGIND